VRNDIDPSRPEALAAAARNREIALHAAAERKWAAETIQAGARGQLARRDTAELRSKADATEAARTRRTASLRKLNAALVIQRCVRMRLAWLYVARVRSHSLAHNRRLYVAQVEAASVRIQSAARGWMWRSLLAKQQATAAARRSAPRRAHSPSQPFGRNPVSTQTADSAQAAAPAADESLLSLLAEQLSEARAQAAALESERVRAAAEGARTASQLRAQLAEARREARAATDKELEAQALRTQLANARAEAHAARGSAIQRGQQASALERERRVSAAALVRSQSLDAMRIAAAEEERGLALRRVSVLQSRLTETQAGGAAALAALARDEDAWRRRARALEREVVDGAERGAPSASTPASDATPRVRPGRRAAPLRASPSTLEPGATSDGSARPQAGGAPRVGTLAPRRDSRARARPLTPERSGDAATERSGSASGRGKPRAASLRPQARELVPDIIGYLGPGKADWEASLRNMGEGESSAWNKRTPSEQEALRNQFNAAAPLWRAARFSQWPEVRSSARFRARAAARLRGMSTCRARA
jgi:hypothetical protein